MQKKKKGYWLKNNFIQFNFIYIALLAIEIVLKWLDKF